MRILLFLSLTFSVTSIHAVTRTWVGGTGNWNAGNNWSPLGIPSAADNIVINSGTVNLQNANGTCLSISLATGASLNINSPRILTVGSGTTSISGSIAISGTMILNGTGTANSGATISINAGGTFTLNGSINANGIITNNGTFTISSSGTLTNYSTLTNAGTLNNQHLLYNFGGLSNNSGSINNVGFFFNGINTNQTGAFINNSTFTNSGECDLWSSATNGSTGIISSITSTSYLYIQTGVTLTNNGFIQNAHVLNVFGTLNNNATFNNNNGGTIAGATGSLVRNNYFLHNYTGATMNLHNFTLGSSSQFLDEGTLTVSGTITANRDLVAGQWHYISSPITTSVTFDGLLTFSAGDYFYRWQEDFYGPSNPAWFPSAWVDIINGADQSGNPVDRLGTETFNKTEGYAIYKVSPYSISLNGSLAKSNEVFPMTYTIPVPPPTTEDYQEGWNFAGNPFPCALAANSATSHADFLLNTANLGNLHTSYQAIYLYNATSYITVSNASGATYVSPYQGFMVRASGAADFLFNAAMRKLNTATFYKNENADPVQRIRLNLTGPQGDVDNVMLAFIDGMTYGLDPGYDAGILKANPSLAIYSRLVEDNGIDFAIQALPTDITDLSVPLGIDAGVAGEYHFDKLMLENIPDSVRIRLEDVVEGTSVDIMTENYSFTVEEPGSIEDRFRLDFYYTAVGLNEPEEAIGLSTFVSDGLLTINSPDPDVKISRVTLVNTLGQVLSGRSFENLERVQLDIPVRNQLVMARVTTTSGTVTKKLFSR